jgi:hypothetical protein
MVASTATVEIPFIGGLSSLGVNFTEWLYEVKLDGYRALAFKAGKEGDWFHVDAFGAGEVETTVSKEL